MSEAPPKRSLGRKSPPTWKSCAAPGFPLAKLGHRMQETTPDYGGQVTHPGCICMPKKRQDADSK